MTVLYYVILYYIILYYIILYYIILYYIQHNGDISLENCKFNVISTVHFPTFHILTKKCTN